MNRDRRAAKRRDYRFWTPTCREGARASKGTLERDEIAPWVIAEVRAWPWAVEDRLVAVRIGVGLRQVQLARKARP